MDILHNKSDMEFGNELAATGNNYIKELNARGDHIFATLRKHIQSFTILGIFLALLCMTYVPSGWLATLLIYIGLLVTVYLLGVKVMHPYMHGAGFRNKKLNKKFSSAVLNVINGGLGLDWGLQHNVRHHSNPNIHGEDDDVSGHGVLRLCANEIVKKIHKLQKYTLYILGIYSTMTLYWATAKDFKQLKRYSQDSKIWDNKNSYQREFKKLIIVKVVFFTLWIVGPIYSRVYLGESFWWSVLIVVSSFVLMHLFLGVLLALTFQFAHRIELTPIIESTAHLSPHGSNPKFGRHKDVHQTETTANFCIDKPFITWCTGALNYQIEHHLFPYIDERHYPELSKRIQRVYYKYGREYYVHKTLRSAYASHMREVKSLAP